MRNRFILMLFALCGVSPLMAQTVDFNTNSNADWVKNIAVDERAIVFNKDTDDVVTDFQAKNDKPNVLLIFIDDFGYSSLGCYGNELVKSPNIDKLASDGYRFTDAYVTPQCTPSRASLLTGQHTARLRMWHVVGRYGYPYAKMKEPAYRENLPHDTYTLAEALKDNGYTTALIGKWHLSTWNKRYPTPDGYYTTLFQNKKVYHGFDYVDISPDPNYHKKSDKGVDYLTNETIAFMERNKDKPFFAYLAHHTAHGPLLAPENLVEKYKKMGYPDNGLNNATYMAMIEHLDNSVGRLLQALDDMELTENTIVMFYSDNGGVMKEMSNTPLREGKGSTYEGGIRVPLTVSWPDKIDENITSDLPVHVTDIFPTIMELTGSTLKADTDLDGLSIARELRGEKLSRDRELFWYMPLYDWGWGATPAAILRKGNYKLIKSFGDYYDVATSQYYAEGKIELFDLKEDIRENRDLYEDFPALAKQMENRLMEWIVDEMKAPLPTLNPDFDEDRMSERAKDFNMSPFVNEPMEDLEILVGESFRFQIPANHVVDYDEEWPSVKVTIEEGLTWPSWLAFNEIEKVFMGVPVAPGKWTFKLEYTDKAGEGPIEEFSIVVK